MELIRWDPFRDLDEISGRLTRFFNRPLLPRLEDETPLIAEWAPAVDIHESDKEYLIKADLPEVAKEHVKVEIQDGVLRLEGERKKEKEEKDKKYHRVERLYGRFVRSFTVPPDVDEAKVAAAFKDGVLHVHMPKTAAQKPKPIEVKVA